MNDEIRIGIKRVLSYGLWLIITVALFWKPGLALFRFSLANDYASHTALIPFISLGLIYVDRRRIFGSVSSDYRLAAVLGAISAIIVIWTLRSAANWTQSGTLAGYTAALVVLWIGGFALFFGKDALQNGSFPLLFLLLTIPLPGVLLDRVVYFLQMGSTDVTAGIFHLLRVPAVREGFVFYLGGFSVEVSRECSGIRSSLALLILTLLAGHFLLVTFWRQAVLVLAGLVIMVVKNGIRIATLTILASYVNPNFLTGDLHHKGGVVFYLIGLVLLWPIYWLLKRGEQKTLSFPPTSSQSL